jgi:hypothetical protein
LALNRNAVVEISDTVTLATVGRLRERRDAASEDDRITDTHCRVDRVEPRLEYGTRDRNAAKGGDLDGVRSEVAAISRTQHGPERVC